MITDEEINKHFFLVSELLGRYFTATSCGKLLIYNQSPIYGTIQSKKGFSVIMEKDKDSYELALNEMVTHLAECNEEDKILFARGCFDGRSSFDTTRHYLSIDVDRDYQRQDLIVCILKSLNLKVNLNRREKDYSKNDQVRIEPMSISDFYNRIGFFPNAVKALFNNT